MPRIWRLVKTKYAAGAFDGEGARLYGARWNSPGVAVAYGSSTIALAVLEVIVHLRVSELLPAYSLVSADVPDDLIEVLPPKRLPKNWKQFPPPSETVAIGDTWVAASGGVALAVPSVIVVSELNYLLNPKHPAFARIVIRDPEPFVFDERLVR